MSKVSPMSEEFHDWLDQCPVQWFRGEITMAHVTYSFETPDEEEGASSKQQACQDLKDLVGCINKGEI